MDFYEVINNAETISIMFRVLSIIILIVAAVMDIRAKKISISIPLTQMTLSVLYFLYLWSKGMDDPKGLMLSLLPGAALLVTSYVTKQGIGLGDGLMVLSLGPLFGMVDIMLVSLIAFTLSALVGGILLISKKAGGKTSMAFMPFLTIGAGVMSFGFI